MGNSGIVVGLRSRLRERGSMMGYNVVDGLMDGRPASVTCGRDVIRVSFVWRDGLIEGASYGPFGLHNRLRFN
jgi:hypothetical protein